MTIGRIPPDQIVEVYDLMDATTLSYTTEIAVGQPVVRYASGRSREELVRNIQVALDEVIKCIPTGAAPDWNRAQIFFQWVTTGKQGLDGVGILPITVG